MGIRDGKLLYHLTQLENLESIFEHGLISRNKMVNEGLSFKDIADHDIIKFRKENGLNNYVPFHFFVKNPFDGRVQKDYMNENFAYICITRKWARNNDSKIIPTHPIYMGNFELMNYDEGIELIEWDIMDNRGDRDYHNDHIRNVCMAEVVIEGVVSIESIHSINVKSEVDKEYVIQLLDRYNINTDIYINVRESWFI